MQQTKIPRRWLLKGAAVGAAAAPFFLSPRAWAAPKEHKLMTLPYPPDALAPYISKETIDYHYGKHHAAYVANLNKLIPGTEFEQMRLEDIVKKAKPGPIFNNAAQAWNHTFLLELPIASRGRADRRPGGGDPEGVRLGGQVQGRVHRRGGEALRLRLGLVGAETRRRLGHREHEQRRKPDCRRQHAAVDLRRLGTCLLHRLPQRPAEVRRGLLEDRQLGVRRVATEVDASPVHNGTYGQNPLAAHRMGGVDSELAGRKVERQGVAGRPPGAESA